MQLFVTLWEVKLAANPPEEVCKGLVPGAVYATVTTSPTTTAVDKVN